MVVALPSAFEGRAVVGGDAVLIRGEGRVPGCVVLDARVLDARVHDGQFDTVLLDGFSFCLLSSRLFAPDGFCGAVL